MSYRVHITKAAREDLHRLYALLLEQYIGSARRERDLIAESFAFLLDFPFSCRKTTANRPFLRELAIPFGTGAPISA